MSEESVIALLTKYVSKTYNWLLQTADSSLNCLVICVYVHMHLSVFVFFCNYTLPFGVEFGFW